MDFVRFVLFCIFFAIGAGAVALSIVGDEVGDYYNNKNILKKIQADNEKIKSLAAEYDLQIQQLQNDPNTRQRLKYITLGQEPSAKDTAFPKVSEKQLATAKLPGDSQSTQEQSNIPKWIKRCTDPKLRQGLFFAGAGLILITFLFFAAPGEPKKDK